MKYAVVVTVEVPDEAPPSVAEQVVQSFLDINNEVAGEARTHFAGLIGITVERGLPL